MKFILKSIGSSVFGFFGSWIGDFINMETSLMLGLLLSIVGWYVTKNWVDKQGF